MAAGNRNDVTALKAASGQLWDKFVPDMPAQEQSVFRLISEQPDSSQTGTMVPGMYLPIF